MAAHAVVASKYDLENAEFDEDRFLNQQGWWDYFESALWDSLIGALSCIRERMRI